MRAGARLEPPHVSAYGLTVEAGTPLALDPARHPDDDDQAAKYELADALLVEAGLASYEISNWARPGHECRHNLLYWSQGDYCGFGAPRTRTGRPPLVERPHARPLHRPRQRRITRPRPRARSSTPRPAGSRGSSSAADPNGVPAGALDASRAPRAWWRPDGDRVVLTRAGRLVANEVSLPSAPARPVWHRPSPALMRQRAWLLRQTPW